MKRVERVSFTIIGTFCLKQRKSDSCPSASVLFSNAPMTTTALPIARTASILSQDSISAWLSSHFIASFVIRAMNLLMASLCDENAVRIASLVTMM